MTADEVLVALAALRTKNDAFPAMLLTARQTVAQEKEAVTTAQVAVDDLKNEITLLVAGETKPDSEKLVYPNELARSAATKQKLVEHTRYKDRVTDLRGTEHRLTVATNALSKLEDERRATEQNATILCKEADILITRAQFRIAMKDKELPR